MKHYEFLYGGNFADILSDGKIINKIFYKKRKLILTDFSGDDLAKIELNFMPIYCKNVIKVYYLKNQRTITVDKQYLGTKYYINLGDNEKLLVKLKWNNVDFEILNQKISIKRIGGTFTKYSHRLEFSFEDMDAIEMIFITFFYVLRIIVDR